MTSGSLQIASRWLLRRTTKFRYALDRSTYERAGASRKIEGLRDIWHHRPAVIVANGPSLNSTPLDEFAGCPSIGMNKIDLIYERVKWRPSFIVCANNLVAAQNDAAWARAGVPVYASWKCRRFISRNLRGEFGYFLSLATPEFSADASRGLGSAGTVTYSALQFAYFAGADPVILVGVDHRFAGAQAGKENVIETRKGPDVDHFDPNYFAAGQKWGIPNLPLSEHGYRLAREAFETDGRRVFDATIDGALTVFEKIGIGDAIRLARS